ncbi:MAG: hypothetical protein WC759_01720 [Candidatus Micrarchaeia archaeon]|jgi:hypothetical protein
MAKELIRACPMCGNPDLKWVGGGGNSVYDFLGTTSLSGQFFCERCGKDILPIEFDSEKNYMKFMVEKAKAKKGKTKPAQKSRRTKK